MEEIHSKKRGAILAFLIYVLEFPILLGNISGWFSVHPVMIFPPLLGLLNAKVEKRGLAGLGLILPYPFRAFYLTLVLTTVNIIGYIHIFTLENIPFSLPPFSLDVFFNLLQKIFVAVFILALWEEFVSRGYIQTRLQDMWGFPGVVLSALMFASLHLPSAIVEFRYDRHVVLLNFLEMGLAGFMLSYIYWKTRSTLTTIAVHGLRNVIFTIGVTFSALSNRSIHLIRPGLQILWNGAGVLLAVIILREWLPLNHEGRASGEV